MYRLFVKRTIDIVLSLFILTLASPIFLITYLVLSITNKGKAFFVQKRPGKNEKIFEIIKFKSMNDKKDTYGQFLPDVDRITKFGQFIRKTSLDEIPQLLNVLKGDMSLIGPRPLLVSYLPLYNEEQRKRHLVRPGITGWAQVNGRNAISWQKKFEYDVWYVNNRSFMTDLKIFWLTFLKVIKRDDISSETSATMEIFTGN
ncbi:Lipid carrier : UDP-N-acetylgalactosaminyltransferase [hydrothermal vent metagenome]|uniref:Lipid carrier: UDP-N-acetylgalactosaminyltransferase n=1 Tax=hydrothermal vent metagenome TaxID=652676 RepID=A0A3B0T709_9ZZZZ